ncbi:hypothetical protein CGLO_08401 [Colletotrichum gloeosporioides Cg-14]|nr:hypothetical protein CGLO_08401 [Colletotrichum gloeosporioides Cg-14]
MRECLII